MTGTLPVRSIRPSLETLERRDQPSFLMTGATSALVQPLNTIFQDMQMAQSRLQQNVQFFQANGNGTTAQQIASTQAFAKATAAYQEILNDQHAITLLANADKNFIVQAAVFEAFNGDTTDYFLLVQGPFFGFDVNAQFTNVVTQANNLANDGNVTGPANTAFILGGAFNIGTPAGQTTPPAF